MKNSLFFLLFISSFAWTNNSFAQQIANANNLKVAEEQGFLFKEVTNSSGIDYSGVSFGHAWTDVDLDGYPDLFCSGHGRAHFYMNQKNGTFKSIEVPLIKKYDNQGNPKFYDLHGVTFADVNHDGYPDLYIQVGGDMGSSQGKENFLFLNDKGTIVFENKAEEYHVVDSLGRGRSALFFDQNKDGYNDFFNANFSRGDNLYSSSLYTYDPGLEIFNRNQNLGLADNSIRTPSLIHSRQENVHHLVSITDKTDYVEVYDYSQVPFKKLFHSKLYGIRDVAVGDYNGDGHQDIFIAANRYSSEAFLQNDTNLMVYLYSKSKALGYTDENKVSFKTDGLITIESTLYPYQDGLTKYWRIGNKAYQPKTEVFTLDPSIVENQNFASLCLICLGVNIGYNTTDNKWEIFNTDPIDNLESAIKITSTKPIYDIQTYQFKNSEVLSIDKLLLNTGDGVYVDEPNFLTNAPNLTSGVSVVSADFDNDMDLDLLISCQGSSVNYPNRYYENDGNGKFALKVDFGAESAVGGRSGSITTADFNNDGFLDVFVENGEGQVGGGANPLHFNDGPYRLYKNKGNSNHWLKFNLTDSESLGNKLAEGAVVYCYINNKKQIRLKGTELHAYAQNDPVIHFGTGQFTKADSVVIIWPDGDKSVYYDLPADSMYNIDGKGIITGLNKPKTNNNYCQEIAFPNPTSGNINLSHLDNSKKIVSIEVVNFLGQSVFFQDIQDILNSYSISTKNWSNGTYIIKVLYQDSSYCNSRVQVYR
jgi:hypothetical protein